MNDGGCIKATLEEMGYQYEEHSTAKPLYGYRGDQRAQKANIIIRRKDVGSSANDIGFLKKGNKYEMIISEFDRSSGKQAKDFMKRMKQIYAKHAFLKQTKKMGYIIKSQKVEKDGRIKIRVSR